MLSLGVLTRQFSNNGDEPINWRASQPSIGTPIPSPEKVKLFPTRCAVTWVQSPANVNPPLAKLGVRPWLANLPRILSTRGRPNQLTTLRRSGQVLLAACIRWEQPCTVGLNRQLHKRPCCHKFIFCRVMNGTAQVPRFSLNVVLHEGSVEDGTEYAPS